MELERLTPKWQRYYYPKKELLGPEYRSEVINGPAIRSICEKAATVRRLRSHCFEDGEANAVELRHPLENFMDRLPVFDEINSRNEDVEIDESEMAPCYLPPVIEFFNEGEPLTYFIAVVGDRCEIRSNRWVVGFPDPNDPDSNRCVWQDVIGRYDAVEDPEVISRMENTIGAYERWLDVLIPIYSRILTSKEEAEPKIIQRNRRRFAKASQSLRAALEQIGIVKRKYDSLIDMATRKDQCLENLFDLLLDKGYVARLDLEWELPEIRWNVNRLLRKQGLDALEETLTASQKRLGGFDAIQFCQERIKGGHIYLISGALNGLYAGVVASDKLDAFLLRMQEAFFDLDCDYHIVVRE